MGFTADDKGNVRHDPDRDRPGRGRIRLDVQAPPSEGSPYSLHEFLGGLAALAIFGLILGMCISALPPAGSGSDRPDVQAPSENIPRFVAVEAVRNGREGGAYGVVFAYDNVRFIAVDSIDLIPRDVRDRAIDEARPPESLHRTLASDTVHIIHGVVSITTGDLFAADELSIRAVINNEQARDISLVLSQAPRGPPSVFVADEIVRSAAATGPRSFVNSMRPPAAEQVASPVQDVGVVVSPSSDPLNESRIRVRPTSPSFLSRPLIHVIEPWPDPYGSRPFRTVYVVGNISAFDGPALNQASVLNAEVLDLAPRAVAMEGVMVRPNQSGYEALLRQRDKFSEVPAHVIETAVGAAVISAVRVGRKSWDASNRDSTRQPPKPPKPTPRR